MAKKTEMTEAAREARRQYMREWNKRNRERKKEQEARYWQRVAYDMGLTDEKDIPDADQTEPDDQSDDEYPDA